MLNIQSNRGFHSMATIQSKQSISERISKTRAKFLVGEPFFGQLALKLVCKESRAVPTACTDGTYLLFNPEFCADLSDIEFKGLFAHEVMHCALRHMYRINGREHELWNIACDYAINQILIDAKFALPKGALIESRYKGQTAEQIYAYLQQNPEGRPGGKNGKGGDYTSTGEFTAPGSLGEDGKEADGGNATEALTNSDWEIAAEQAAITSKKAGKMPGGIEIAVKTVKPQKNWKDELRNFIQKTLPSDYSWIHPNRRFVWQGIYLPGIEKENCPRIAVGFDTSGSIYADRELCALFASEITGILHDARPEAIDIYYCDARVHRVDTYSPEDREINFDALPGGEGTAFQPVFDEIEKRPNELPALAIYLTDLQGPAPVDPGYPVLWVTTEATTQDAWFGETIRITQYLPK
jgi:predicted metal-dependent peptidase